MCLVIREEQELGVIILLFASHALSDSSKPLNKCLPAIQITGISLAASVGQLLCI